MLPPLAPLPPSEMLLQAIRQSLQKSLLWCELAAELCHDSQQLCDKATHLTTWSKQVLEQKASLRSESMA